MSKITKGGQSQHSVYFLLALALREYWKSVQEQASKECQLYRTERKKSVQLYRSEFRKSAQP